MFLNVIKVWALLLLEKAWLAELTSLLKAFCSIVK